MKNNLSHDRAGADSCAVVPATSVAARAWLLPSQTIVARAGGWVTFDAANSDDLFSFNQGAMPIDAAECPAPMASRSRHRTVAKGKTRSSFDLELRAAGTYRVAVAGDTVMARWEEDGKPKRWRGTAGGNGGENSRQRGEAGSRTDAAARRNVRHRRHADRTEGTRASGSSSCPIQHPNDLYAGEAAKFRFLLDGKPAQDLEVRNHRGRHAIPRRARGR